MLEYSLTSAIIGHLVGDYILQNDWMALNKKQKSFPCLIHCLIYTVCVMLFAEWWNIYIFFILISTHFILDRTSIVFQFMKLTGKEKFATGILSPWSIIAVDNVIHIVIIWIIWRIIII